MLPDILIVGAQKAATGTIFEALAAHPDVAVARDPNTGESVKEVHFFDNAWSLGSSWYASHYDADERRGLDATPNYLSFVHTHARMREMVPKARLVVSLRDPIERAYSQYNHYKQDLPRSRSWDWLAPEGDFAQNVKAELELKGLLEPRFRGLIGRGYYVDQLESLLGCFSREQLHVMVVERWTTEPEEAIADLLGFLGLPKLKLPIGTAHRRAYTVEPLDPETRQLLGSAFKRSSARLFELLGDEIPEWSQPAG